MKTPAKRRAVVTTAKTAKPAKSKSKVKRVYFFGDGRAEGGREMKPLLGGKGANLAEMALLGLPVPPGFTITTDVCEEYWRAGGKLPPKLWDEVAAHLARVEKTLGATFGKGPSPTSRPCCRTPSPAR